MIIFLQLFFTSQQKKSFFQVKKTQQHLNILNILKKLNFIYFFSINDNLIKVFLKKNVIKSINFFSKPGRRMYCSVTNLQKVRSINKIVILKTTQGVITCTEAIKNKQGGELICEIIF